MGLVPAVECGGVVSPWDQREEQRRTEVTSSIRLQKQAFRRGATALAHVGAEEPEHISHAGGDSKPGSVWRWLSCPGFPRPSKQRPRGGGEISQGILVTQRHGLESVPALE